MATTAPAPLEGLAQEEFARLSVQRADDPEFDAWFDGFRVPTPGSYPHATPLRDSGVTTTILTWLSASATLAEARGVTQAQGARDAETARRDFAAIRDGRARDYLADQLTVRAHLSFLSDRHLGVSFDRLVQISHCLRDDYPETLAPMIESVLAWLETGKGMTFFFIVTAGLQLENAIVHILTLAYDLRWCEERLGTPRAESWANHWLERAWGPLFAAAALELP